MDKKRAQIQTVAVVAFSFLLAFSAARSNTTGRGELGELQIAMRNLNRVDNLQMSYVYTIRQNASEGGEAMDVWANLLTGSWMSKHYTTDEDGTRLYLRQFCDGKDIYHYIDWNGDWEKIQTTGEGGTAVPQLQMMTTLGYDGGDVLELKRQEQDGSVEIICSFAPEFLEEAKEAQLAQLERSYAMYEKSGVGESEIDTAELSVEQHRQSRYETVTATYTIDENQILQKASYETTIIMPEIVQDLDGNKSLGKERKMQITVDMEIERYNQSGINNQIEQCRNEMMY